MKNAIFCLITGFGLIACGGGGGNGGHDLPSTPQPVSGVLGDGRLEELVNWTRETHGLPAMAVVVVSDGQISELSAQGLRSIESTEPVTAADAWHIGSLTKGLTSSLVGALVELSVVSWDTRPLDVWPELDATIRPEFRNITIRHLLAHTAGVQRINSAPSRFGDTAPGTVVEKRRTFAAEILASPPVSAIGQHSYSNGGYIIVGAMLESMMSVSWESLLTQYVFSPLNMTASGFGAPGSAGGLSQPLGHWDTGRRFEPVSPGPDADNPQVFGPAGTVHTTLGDYATFMIAHIDGAQGVGGFLTVPTYNVLHAPLDDGAALGWGVANSTAFPGLKELVHAGSNQRWYAIVRLIPEIDGGALFISNAGGDLSSAAINAIDDIVVERFKNANQ